MKNKINYIIFFLLLLVIGLLSFPTVFKNKKDIIDEKVLADASNTPKLISTYYNTNHFIVADYILSPSSGDMTNLIQDTLNKCNSNGGGTVWLEKGIYNVSSPITIPSACTLMGDWQDPDNYQGTLDYGTKIIVDVNTFKSDNANLEDTGLFKMKSSSGIEGITIYYKNQNISNPKPQPWSFYYTSWKEDYGYVGVSVSFTIRNVTMINSYRGIGRDMKDRYGHASLMLENVKGTILKSGLVVHTSYDVGTIVGMKFIPKYLATANFKAFNDTGSYSESNIVNAIKNIEGTGMTMTKVDLSQYEGIELSGFKYGIYVPSLSDKNIITEGGSSASFYNLNISNCTFGIYVENGKRDNYTLLNRDSGLIISKGSIDGSDYAIFNNSDVISINNQKYVATLKLNDISIKGKVGGNGSILYYDKVSNSYKEVPHGVDLTNKINDTGKFSNLNMYRKLKNDGSNFISLSQGSSVEEINSALSSVSSKGGGVVYLKPGKYTIDGPIYVPSNVELRGSSSVINRNYTLGTVFTIVFNKKDDYRVINITGDNAGVSGINFMYPDTIKSILDGRNFRNHDYTIVVQDGKNNYVRNIAFGGASFGVYFNKETNFTMEYVVGYALYNFVRVDDSSNGVIKNLLHNMNVIAYSRYFNPNGATESNKFSDVPLKNLKFIHLYHSSDIEIENCFPFRANSYLKVENSNFYVVNATHDDSEHYSKYLVENSKSTGIIVNALKWSKCANIDNTVDSNIGIYNLMKLNYYNENDLLNNIFKVSKKYIVPVLKTDTEVSFNNLEKKEINYYYDGDGKVSCNSSNEASVKCSVSDKKIIITPIANSNGQVKVTLSASSGINYSKTSTIINVSVNIKTSNGDVDNDGKVSSSDYILVKKHILKTSLLTGDKLKKADVNFDGKVNSSDYILIKKTIMNSK